MAAEETGPARSPTASRSATARVDDAEALLPLMRGYCDFYEVDPPDEGLLEMARTR